MTKAKTLKPDFLPGGARRQELLENAVDYLRKPDKFNQLNMSFV